MVLLFGKGGVQATDLGPSSASRYFSKLRLDSSNPSIPIHVHVHLTQHYRFLHIF